MSVIASTVSSLDPRSLATGQDLLTRSLARLATLAQAGNPAADLAALTGSGSASAAGSGLQAASAGVQSTLSSVQTADGYLDGMSSLLSQLGDLAHRAQDKSASAADVAQLKQQFGDIQQQLRSIIGGQTSAIGGAADVTSAAGTFKGADLFGASADGSANPVDLQHGAMLNLIAQDGTGGFTLGATDADADANISAASQQVSAGRSALAAKQSDLELAAARLQVEQQNLYSSFSPIADANAAQQANLFAQGNILGQGGDALAAQAGQSPATVLNLVQL
jgi:flagellin